MKKKIILWTNDVEYLLPDEKKVYPVGGIQVQMFMWSVTLCNNGWDVYTFTNNYSSRNKKFSDIKFLYLPSQKYVKAILSFIYYIFYLIFYRPHVILLNGATRDLFLVNLIAKIIGSTTIEMFASDSDLQPGNELIDRKLDKALYRLGVRMTTNFIVQNSNQADLLKAHFGKENPLTIPLIWIEGANTKKDNEQKSIILYVSNFRKLKRPKWFLQLAKDNPEYKFVMVGSDQELDLYEDCRQQALEIPNLDFLGGLSFAKTNELFKSARVFVCTSEIEGFPNTFPQAWMNGCPILTTFDPGGLINNRQLGIACENYKDMLSGLKRFSEENFLYSLQSNIKEYYNKTFSAQMHYENFIERFNLK